jgi:uncharacterized protein (TIGR02285 family)
MNIEKVPVQVVKTKRGMLIKKVLCTLRFYLPYFSLLCVTLIVSFQLSAAEKKQDIIIVSDDRSPSSLDLATKSFYYIQELLKDKLTFSEVSSTHRRAWRLITARPNVCIYNKVKNAPRERLAIYTKYPLVIFPPNRLMTFDSPNLSYNVSLTQLVKEQKLKVGVVDARSYGKGLDEEIAEIQSYLVILPGFLSAKRLRKMFVQGKLDAIIEYSAVFLDDPDLDIPSERLSFHQLDSATEFVSGYIACSKSEMGAYVINLFDKMLHKEKNIKKLIEMNQKEFPQAEHKAIEDAFNKLHNHK